MPLSSRPSNYNLRPLNNSQATEQNQQPQVVAEPAQVEQPPLEVRVANKELTMANNVFRLENFKGDGTQDIDSYFKRFTQYQKCTGINDDQALATLAWHLEGNARLWFEQLAEEPNTLKGLKDAMVAKYKLERPVNMGVYTLKQSVGESANDFLRRVESECFKNKITEEVQVQIALHGLDRTLSSAISTHAPKTLDEVRKLTSRIGSVNLEAAVAQATPSQTIPTRLETTVEVLTAAVAKLAATMEKPGPNTQTEEACSRCGGRCFSLANCRAKGKYCYKCNKLNHFGNKCRSNQMSNASSSPQHPQQRQNKQYRQGQNPRYGPQTPQSGQYQGYRQ